MARELVKARVTTKYPCSRLVPAIFLHTRAGPAASGRHGAAARFSIPAVAAHRYVHTGGSGTHTVGAQGGADVMRLKPAHSACGTLSTRALRRRIFCAPCATLFEAAGRHQAIFHDWPAHRNGRRYSGIADLARKVCEVNYSIPKDQRTKGLRVTVSASSFVPKPLRPSNGSLRIRWKSLGASNDCSNPLFTMCAARNSTTMIPS